MESTLQHIKLQNFRLQSGKILDVDLSYQIFGMALFTAPIILVNHALTGNSNISGKNGWWKSVVGDDNAIDTTRFTVIIFNIPGNGFDGFFIDDFEKFCTRDIAVLFIEGLHKINITKLFAIIGGSVGGAIGWEMLALKKDLADKFIPIATDYKTSDWLHSQCLVQDFLLNAEKEPLQKARIHAMLCYRTPQSINERFNLEKNNSQILQSHDWLNYHGNALNERFSLKSYKLVNQLLKTINVNNESVKNIKSEIHLIAVDSDLFFPAFEIKNCFEFLKVHKQNVFYHEINSVHGHDAFLMEYEQIINILKSILYESES